MRGGGGQECFDVFMTTGMSQQCNNYSANIHLQDSNPAGTIFAEDIVDVCPDYEEKDSKVSQDFAGLVSLLTRLPHSCHNCSMPSSSRSSQRAGITFLMPPTAKRE